MNENFDAGTYGVEVEAIFNPVRQLTISANVGLQKSRLRDGQGSLDVMNRTQGNPDYVVVKPFVQIPSNCVVRRDVVEQIVVDAGSAVAATRLAGICPGSFNFSNTSIPADAFPNGGRGFDAPVGGNEMPNTPHFTANIGAEYNIPVGGSWFVTPRIDAYHQSESWARVYNTSIDRLKGWENVNVSLWIGNPAQNFMIEAYVKNLFDSTPITDAFINSDDTGLTTNVFTYDPRIIGLNFTKKF